MFGCPSYILGWDPTCSEHNTGVLHPRGGSGGTPQGPYVGMLPPVVHERKRKRNAHAPSLLLLPEGSLLAAWFAGEEGTSGVLIATSFLRRDSWQWDPPRVAAHTRRCKKFLHLHDIDSAPKAPCAKYGRGAHDARPPRHKFHTSHTTHVRLHARCNMEAELLPVYMEGVDKHTMRDLSPKRCSHRKSEH